MCAGDKACARAADGDFGRALCRQQVAQSKRRARRRVALTRMMRFLYERRVSFNTAEQFGGVRDDAVEEIDADREVRAVNERPIAALNLAPHLTHALVPARSP